MDMGDKEKFELEKRNDDPMNYHSSPGMSSDWRFSAPNLSSVSMGMIPNVNPMGSSSCSTASMVDSYSPTLWDHPNAAMRSVVDKSLDIGWNNSPSPMMKGGVFFPGMLPQSLSQFPADSAFIERAARFSSFNGGSFSDMVNPFCVPEPMALYSRGVGMAQEQHESYKNELSVAKNVSVSLEQGAMDGSPLKNEGRSESLVRSRDGATQGVGGSGNESDEADEAEFSGQGGQDEPSTLDDIGFRKRKRSGQETETDKTEEASQQAGDSAKDKTETLHKGDQNPTSATNKAAGKHGKSDPGKDEYIHVRARRGQATNSHSLAERVRREKISERMKFLQDLVPGCSKVTGKAVMLDEIINYVQSLQRQVEFLSMKLATVNPRLDVNIEGLLTKDILQSRPGPSSSLGYALDMPMAYPLLHPSQPELIQRNISPQLTPMSAGFKESSQVPNMWEDELHNVVQMNFGTSSQDVNESNTSGQMKVEL